MPMDRTTMAQLDERLHDLESLVGDGYFLFLNPDGITYSAWRRQQPIPCTIHEGKRQPTRKELV